MCVHKCLYTCMCVQCICVWYTCVYVSPEILGVWQTISFYHKGTERARYPKVTACQSMLVMKLPPVLWELCSPGGGGPRGGEQPP